jgi:hypothetical protein
VRAQVSAEARSRNKGARWALKRWVGGWRVRSLVNFSDIYPATRTEKAGKVARKTLQRGGRSASLFCLAVSVPPTCPRGDGGPRRGGSRDGKSGYDLGAGLTECDGGIDERPREEIYFASMSPPFSGKTEVMRELDKASPSTLSNADHARPIGTPVRWELTVHREGRAAAFISHFLDIFLDMLILITKLILLLLLRRGTLSNTSVASNFSTSEKRGTHCR